MTEAVAYSTLALTVTLAVSRPRLGLRLRITPGAAALLGVIVLLLARVLHVGDLAAAARVQWRPLVSLAGIMVMTGVVQESGAFDRLAARIEAHARATSTARAFTLVFALAAATAALLNNDSAILLLTPLVVALGRRLAPRDPRLCEALAFAVFLAPGVAPLVVSNPMNMIVAEYAGVGFNAYARLMVPISVAGALATWAVVRWAFRARLAVAAPTVAVALPARKPAERPALALLVGVFVAYPLVVAAGGPIWIVTLAGAAASLLLAARFRVASPRRLAAHVSVDVMLFLWGAFLVVAGLEHVGVVERLAALYTSVPSGSGAQLALVGTGAALGSAAIDNHPMALLNMMALGAHGSSRPLLAALIGGDIGPRLLPIGSLAGLLWMDILRRHGVRISVGSFVRLGALAVIPALTLSLLLLHLM